MVSGSEAAAWSIKIFKDLPKMNVHINQKQTLSRLVNSFAATGDLTITVALIYLLHSSKSGVKTWLAGHSQSDADWNARMDVLLNHLILFSLNTGLLASLCSLMALVMFTIFPGACIYIAFYSVLSRPDWIKTKVYTNSLLTSLNNRRKVSAGATATEPRLMSIQLHNTRSNDTDLLATTSCSESYPTQSSHHPGTHHPIGYKIRTAHEKLGCKPY
ncbi:hypothetical protein B0H10DRAFT_1940457 [Mycena sp. CBHHK59/15]|nr:hypothetical protein B0H10DRAFT_1940457 [Mycena sp. CBHHK59/15]